VDQENPEGGLLRERPEPAEEEVSRVVARKLEAERKGAGAGEKTAPDGFVSWQAQCTMEKGN
jgi:hypothetical protein